MAHRALHNITLGCARSAPSAPMNGEWVLVAVSVNRSKSTVAIPYDGIMFTPIHGSHQGRPAQSTHPAWWTVTGYQGSANQASPIHPSCMVDCHWIPIKALLTRPAQSTHPAWWTATGYQGTANQASPIHPSCMVNWNSLKIKAEHIAAHRLFFCLYWVFGASMPSPHLQWVTKTLI